MAWEGDNRLGMVGGDKLGRIVLNWEKAKGLCANERATIRTWGCGCWEGVGAYFFNKVCANQNILCTFALRKMVLRHIG